MIFTLLYDDHAKLQIMLLEIAKIDFQLTYHNETMNDEYGGLEAVPFVTIRTGDDQYDS